MKIAFTNGGIRYVFERGVLHARSWLTEADEAIERLRREEAARGPKHHRRH